MTTYIHTLHNYIYPYHLPPPWPSFLLYINEFSINQIFEWGFYVREQNYFSGLLCCFCTFFLTFSLECNELNDSTMNQHGFWWLHSVWVSVWPLFPFSQHQAQQTYCQVSSSGLLCSNTVLALWKTYAWACICSITDRSRNWKKMKQLKYFSGP